MQASCILFVINVVALLSDVIYHEKAVDFYDKIFLNGL